jgi:hypothetical protein
MKRFLYGLAIAGLAALPVLARISIAGPTAPDGATQVAVDLPADQRIKNIGSRVDGAGMCVMSSVEMAARWANLEDLRGLRDWCAKQSGGAYPAKVDRQLREYAAFRSINVPEYGQLEDASYDDVAAVLRSGRLACVTYAGYDGVRYRGPIAHMVCAVHANGAWVALLDNNAVGENELMWMTPQEFDRRFRDMGGGWLFWWCSPPPPPVPAN